VDGRRLELSDLGVVRCPLVSGATICPVHDAPLVWRPPRPVRETLRFGLAESTVIGVIRTATRVLQSVKGRR